MWYCPYGLGDRQIALVSVGRSDRGHLSPLLALLPTARLYEYQSAIWNAPFEFATAAGYAVSNFANQFHYNRPDVVVIFGDRWEQHAAATAAFTLGLPIVHLHAGERTEAVLDDGYRDAISALATIHVAAAEPYATRLRGMGYTRVYCLGAPGLARLPQKSLTLIWYGYNRALDQHLSMKPTILVAFHPETRNLPDVPRQVAELVAALVEAPGRVICTDPGMDAGREAILTAYPFQRFTGAEWLNALDTADVLVGNSSCGIIEAPSIPLPSVNIGDRQKGRLQASSVIQVAHDRDAIRAGIALALNPEWRSSHLTGENPYGDRHAAERIAELLTTVEL